MQTLVDTSHKSTAVDTTSSKVLDDGIANEAVYQNGWLCVLIISLLAGLLIIYILNRRKSATGLEALKRQNIDMENVMFDIHRSRELYNELKVKCHPDRFIGLDKMQQAEKIFQELSDNKHNYLKLLELKERINNEL